jgi:lipoate-protein ligase A
LPPDRGLWIFEVTQPALVLGSRQADVDVADIEVARRRSGGGAVYVTPANTLWIDVVIPRGDDWWDDDVGRATHWLGRAWSAALGPPAITHLGPMIRSPYSDAVCFAGLGPGEVTIDGRKAVGISQRRTRDSARFQCVAYAEWEAGPLVRLAPATEV